LRRIRVVFVCVGKRWMKPDVFRGFERLYTTIQRQHIEAVSPFWSRRRQISICGRKARLGSVSAACLDGGGYAVGRWLKRPQSNGGAGDGCDAGRPGFRAQFEPTMYYAPDGES
jgi:hypothetical protein